MLKYSYILEAFQITGNYPLSQLQFLQHLQIQIQQMRILWRIQSTQKNIKNLR